MKSNLYNSVKMKVCLVLLTLQCIIIYTEDIRSANESPGYCWDSGVLKPPRGPLGPLEYTRPPGRGSLQRQGPTYSQGWEVKPGFPLHPM